MERIVSGNNGISIELIMQKIKKETQQNETIKQKRKTIKKVITGKMTTSDWKKINIGIKILRNIVNEGLIMQEREFRIGEKDVGKIKKEVVGYRKVINHLIQYLDYGSRREYKMYKRLDFLEQEESIIQAARDGVLLKKEKRIENIDGKEKIVFYDSSITPSEIQSLMNEYALQEDENMRKKMDTLLGVGMGIAGILGTNQSLKKSDEKGEYVNFITFATVAISVIDILVKIYINKERNVIDELRSKDYSLQRDFLSNESISTLARKDKMEHIKEIEMKVKDAQKNKEEKEILSNVAKEIALALLAGIYVGKSIEISKNGKLDGKSLALALARLENTKGLAEKFIDTISNIISNKEDKRDYEENCKKLAKIFEQMEKKVYPLKGAKNPFNSLEIKEFTGKFYPKKDYETKKIHYATKIKIPEFSMKRGDIVLLSGESGAGKSTFLRFLKRGDINNRNAIKLDNGEFVDNLGDEYISFRPSINLGEETNVLYQITGKESISDLSEKEKKNLIDTLRNLKFTSPKLLEELATKKIMEFSTGQQKRLALSKVFYRIDDGTSVIIVDEPVGNVEDKLVREQLELIKNYAEMQNVMVILVTHRLDLAKDLVTKHYNINKEGVLKEIPIKKKEVEQEID